MTGKECAVIMYLYQQDFTTPVKSVSLKKLDINIKKVSINTIRKALKKAMLEGYVSEGIKEAQSKTYYLTKKGYNWIDEIAE